MIVYLLHVENPRTGVDHYVGSTREDQFERRLADHCAGNGSIGSHGLWLQYDEWWLATYWRTIDRALEHAVANTGQLETFCPICIRRSGKANTVRTRRLTKVTETRDDVPLLTWSSAAGP